MKKYIVEDFVSSRKLAVLENDKIDKLIIDIKSKKSYINNIYRGRVTKVLKNISACFVDVGGDIGYLNLGEEEVKEGDILLVQAKKDPIDDKKMRLSLELGIRGRYVVYLPSNNRLTFSKKISSRLEKNRIKEIIENIKKDSLGFDGSFIIRTEADKVSENDLKKDCLDLIRIHKDVEEKFKSSYEPKLLYQPIDRVSEYIKNHINGEVDEVICLEGGYETQLREIIASVDRSYLLKIHKKSLSDLFEDNGVNYMMSKLSSRIVRLDSGAYIVIDKTEAMTVIDVNTGSSKVGLNQEDAIYKINIEACKEIAFQIMNRDIGGIIIVDFIDMSKERTKSLRNNMIQFLREDSNRTRVYEFTNLGLLEMARMRKDISIDYYFSCDSFILDKIEQEVIRCKIHKNKDTLFIRDIKGLEIYPLKYNDLKDKINTIANKYSINIEY